MRITILGGAGFLGRKIAARLSRDNKLGDEPITSLTLFDITTPPEPEAAFPIHAVAGDLGSASQRFWAFRRILDGTSAETLRLARALARSMMRHFDLPALTADDFSEARANWRVLDEHLYIDGVRNFQQKLRRLLVPSFRPHGSQCGIAGPFLQRSNPRI